MGLKYEAICGVFNHSLRAILTMDLPSHQLSMTVLMTPGKANFAGNVHGATILKLLDKMVFRRPFHVGKPVSVEERKRHAAAEVQREMRREMEQRFAEIRSGSWRTRCQHAADTHLLHI